MIEKFIKRISVHKAVYWGTPAAAADGSNTFGNPVEIDCFWKEESETWVDKDNREVFVTAKVYVTQDLDEEGMLYRGTLADLSAAQEADPRKVPEAYEITRFMTVPSLYLTNDFNRCAIISPRRAR